MRRSRRRVLMLLPGLGSSAALAAVLGGCGAREEAVASLPPFIGYRHLTPLRVNVAEVEILDPAPGVVRVSEPAPLRPEQLMARMAQERLIAVGTTGRARFVPEVALLLREPLPTSGSWFRTEQAERLSCTLRCRLEILSGEGRRVAFSEAEARRTRTLAEGTGNEARARAMEELLRQTMDDLNVEFEFQVRRNLRAWLMDGAPGAVPGAPLGPGGIMQEELPSAGR